ncbi:MAG: hypothetical protein HC905_21540 [Bacteroidales bacterium]|nr:hypothetical protein [Bacteroidales bacterium]
MYLSTFPLSEILSIAGIILSSVYIVFGLIGNYQSSHQQEQYKPEIPQQQEIKADSNILSKELTEKCFFVKDITNQSAKNFSLLTAKFSNAFPNTSRRNFR